MQPAYIRIRYMGVRNQTIQKIPPNGGGKMEQMIRWLIRAAVESFPIDRKKKAEILKRLTERNLHGGEYHE